MNGMKRIVRIKVYAIEKARLHELIGKAGEKKVENSRESDRERYTKWIKYGMKILLYRTSKM